MEIFLGEIRIVLEICQNFGRLWWKFVKSAQISIWSAYLFTCDKYLILKLGYQPYKVWFTWRHCRVGGGGVAEGVSLIVDSTTISNLFYNLHFAPKSTIYNIQAQFGYNLQFFSNPKISKKIYKILARRKCELQGFFRRIYSIRMESPPPPTVGQNQWAHYIN